jgi:hypothetical protein
MENFLGVSSQSGTCKVFCVKQKYLTDKITFILNAKIRFHFAAPRMHGRAEDEVFDQPKLPDFLVEILFYWPYNIKQ